MKLKFCLRNAAGGEFRDYSAENARFEIVKKAYSDMHTHQTLEFVQGMHNKWRKFDKGEYTIREIITMLDELGNVTTQFFTHQSKKGGWVGKIISKN